MSKYAICQDCYYNHREPAICEGCDNGSDFEPKAGSDDETAAGAGMKKVRPFKVMRRMKKVML